MNKHTGESHEETAQTKELAQAIAKILPALEAFNRFEGKDNAALNKNVWSVRLGGALPQKGEGLEAVIRELNETVIPNGLRNGAPGFSGWITTAPTVSGTCAALASAVAGSQRVWEHSFNFLETQGLQWLKELLGIPQNWQGIFVGGGSEANIIGLAAARQKAFESIGIDPAKNGLPSEKRWRMYCSTETHHVVTRASAVLGLGRANVAQIAVMPDFKIDLKALRAQLEEDRARGIVPVAIVATAGTVNTGVVDPINAMADLAEEFGTWLHIDGAYGLFGRLDPRAAHLYAGLERAHSAAVDPHKWLAAPVGCGAAFVCDRALLGRALTLEPAEYLEGSAKAGEARSPFDTFGDVYHDFGLAQSAPSRGVMVWAILKEIGAEGMRQRVIRHNGYARYLADAVRADARLELMSEPELSICCFRYKAEGLTEGQLDQLNETIAEHLRANAGFVPSTTRLNGRFVIRPCFINSRTTQKDVDGLLKSVIDIGQSLRPAP